MCFWFEKTFENTQKCEKCYVIARLSAFNEPDQYVFNKGDSSWSVRAESMHILLSRHGGTMVYVLAQRYCNKSGG